MKGWNLEVNRSVVLPWAAVPRLSRFKFSAQTVQGGWVSSEWCSAGSSDAALAAAVEGVLNNKVLIANTKHFVGFMWEPVPGENHTLAIEMEHDE